MSYVDYEDMFITAKEYFASGEYKLAEPLLNQVLLKNSRSPELFHMLGTIYYDQGKFNKAIRSFKKALELDPTYTDASVGLSIILNDLGRYAEGQKVFEDARKILDERQNVEDPIVNEKLALKHDELAELYKQYKRPKEALEQFYKALNLTSKKTETTMKIIDLFVETSELEKAIELTKKVMKDFPDFIPAKLKLGEIYYSQGQVALAVQEWENILIRKPNHPQALRFLKQAQTLSTRDLNSHRPLSI